MDDAGTGTKCVKCWEDALLGNGADSTSITSHILTAELSHPDNED